MKIYTKTGDNGTTRLLNGQRVLKSNPELEILGDLDELNSSIGLAIAHIREATPEEQLDFIRLFYWLEKIQNELFLVGVDIANPKSTAPKITSSHISQLEEDIDSLENILPPLKNFILPGGRVVAAQLHYCRSVCRRLERNIVRNYALNIASSKPSNNNTVNEATDNSINIDSNPENDAWQSDILVYINRLSDALFQFARFANVVKGQTETIWRDPYAEKPNNSMSIISQKI